MHSVGLVFTIGFLNFVNRSVNRIVPGIVTMLGPTSASTPIKSDFIFIVVEVNIMITPKGSILTEHLVCCAKLCVIVHVTREDLVLTTPKVIIQTLDPTIIVTRDPRLTEDCTALKVRIVYLDSRSNRVDQVFIAPVNVFILMSTIVKNWV